MVSFFFRPGLGAASGNITLTPAVVQVTPNSVDPDVFDFSEAIPTQEVVVGGLMPAALLDAAFGPVGRIYRRVDIYNPGGTVIWMYDAPLVAGQVTVDMGRLERRMLDMTLRNEDGELSSDPSRLWYNKVIKVWRGVETDAMRWETQIGEFLIDRIEEPHFPYVVNVTGRDYGKWLAEPFESITQFNNGASLESVARGIAAGAGVSKFALPSTGRVLTRSFPYDPGKARGDALNEILGAYGYEHYFTPNGYFTIRPWVDPFTAPGVFTFQTGSEGNLAAYNKSTNDTEVKNRVMVVGKASDTLPVVSIAENHELTSPTSIENLGQKRTYTFESSFVSEQSQADTLAAQLLAIHGLESYEVSLDSLVVPWLEAGSAITFEDPRTVRGAPNRFLLTEFNIPLGLGVMTSTAKRITLVGS